jgi:hypothetical protein
MHRLKFVLAGLLIATPAFAQPEEGAPVEGEAEAGAEVGAEASVGMEDGTPPVEGAGDAAMFAAWGKSAIDRPYFRAKGKMTVGGDLNLLKISFPDPTGMGAGFSATVDYITLGGAYAVSDQISVGALYAVSLGLGDGDAEFVGPLALWGGYQIKHDAKMSVAATGAFAVNLDDTDQKGIGLGLGLRMNVAPKIGLFTGAPYGPGAVGGSGFGGGPLGGLFGSGGHLNISLADMGPITFDLPVGAMFQATPEMNIHVTTTLASIALSNSPYADADGEKSAIIIGADYFPLTVGGLFAVNETIDVTAGLALPDLKEAQFDLFIFSVGARAHL